MDTALIPNVPGFGAGVGIGSEFGVFIPPGGRIAAFVRATSVDGDMYRGYPIFTTLNAALAQCRSGQPDVVLVLPGHTENISAADQMTNLVAGTRIIGLGYGTNRPTFTWTAATATFLFDVANVMLANCILEMAGDPTLTAALAVAAPITVTASGCGLFNCLVRAAVDADQYAAIPLTLSTTADDFTLSGCHFFGSTLGISTTFVRLNGADRLLMDSCVLQGATSATGVGVVQCITTASTNIIVRRCTFINRIASSTSAFTGLAACTGVIEGCNFGILNDSGLVGFTVPGDIMGYRNFTVNLAGEQGGATTPISV